ncbi:transglutaminase domain-containing protein [Winogradskyella aquimaris]|uniref:DUF3857 domain-containing protein n=1 Tax=Winogradskyella aquimaris TaxID=864074 RepID=A0ABU5EJX9_9FLAO|nr:transglutaminase domain-containing protein [Winogradskyella aquimaris]MDY2585740.1 DUF3857 domain-containing protein [Winogradskyella aquimaris]
MTKNLILVFTFSLVFIQKSITQEVKFGKVSQEELNEKFYEKDSSANAAILYRNQKTYFSSTVSSVELVTEIHERIKVYNKEGFDKATVTFNLFKSRGTKNKVSKIKAYTFNLEGSKIKKTELDKDQIFKSEYSYNYNQVKFTMPNVKEGSVLDISYKITSPFYFNIEEFRFQYDIPIKKIEAELRTPDGYNFNTKNKGHISFYPERSRKRDVRMNMTVDVLNYTLEDVPALKDESYVNNINNYRAGVLFELTSILVPGQRTRYYSTSWKDVAQTIGSSDDYRNELDKTRSFDDSLDIIIAEHPDAKNKMKAIFKYLKEQISWNGIDGKYFQKGIKKALNEKKGNAGDINLTLVAMLRYAGIDANPVVISTKENLVPYFPTVDRLNYVIAYVVLNDQEYFLDATDEFSDINLLPIKDYNWQGVLIDNNNMVWRKVGIKNPDPGITQYMVNATINEEGGLEGSVMSRYTNHSAYSFRKGFKDQDLDNYLSTKEEQLNDIEISNYKVNNADTYEGYVSETYEFYKESSADILDGKIYIEPNLFLKTFENPFKLEQREFPVDFGYPVKEKQIININFPEGYVAESIPESLILKLPEDLGEFLFSPKIVGNNINLTVSVELNKSMMGPETYPYLKEFFNQMVNKQKEQIVLVKAEP